MSIVYTSINCFDFCLLNSPDSLNNHACLKLYVSVNYFGFLVQNLTSKHLG